MKQAVKQVSLLVLTLMVLCGFDSAEGWFPSGSNPKSYNMGFEKGAGINGGQAATIQSKEKKIKGFGTLMQYCSPEKFKGKRIRMSGYLKSENVDGTAGFWLRIDQACSQNPLSFDNMYNRPIRGTSAYKKYEIVLDVPIGASMIAYGALLEGTGQIWFDDISFEIVSDSVASTGSINGQKDQCPEVPVNLNFENK